MPKPLFFILLFLLFLTGCSQPISRYGYTAKDVQPSMGKYYYPKTVVLECVNECLVAYEKKRGPLDEQTGPYCLKVCHCVTSELQNTMRYNRFDDMREKMRKNETIRKQDLSVYNKTLSTCGYPQD